MSSWVKLLCSLAGLALLSCGAPQVTVDAPLAIVNVAPHDGAVGIDVLTRPTVCFSEPMDAAAAQGALVLLLVDGDLSTEVASKVESSSADPNCLVLTHDKLKADALHVIHARKGLKSASGKALAAEIVSRFKTSL